MKITELLLAELDREAVGIRKTLERVPEGKNDWKPHEKSMALGYLATIVATIPGWVDLIVNQDELDINPVEGPKYKPRGWKTRRDLLEQFEASLEKAREVLRLTSDDRLLTTKWRMLAAGRVMSEQTRYEAIRDGVFNHMAHHRGQLTVYLRLNGEKVPAIYGPSADEGKVASSEKRIA
ncbi:MAG: DinB family protein [Terriglobales bacterium]